MGDQEIYDIIISGLGCYGASTLYQASLQNKKVLGIEQFTLLNGKSSSVGETRITRLNVFEGTVYPEIAQKSQKIVEDIEQETNQKLQFIRGGLYIGLPHSRTIQGILEAEQLYNLKVEKLTSEQINVRYPVLKVPEGFIGIIENTAGYCYNEKIIQSFIDLALKNPKASIKENTKVLDYVQKSEYLEVYTDKGVFKTKKLVLAEGIGMVNKLRELNVPIRLQKNQAAWLKWNVPEVDPLNMPILYWDYYTKQHQIYCFPNVGTGFKIGLHKRGEEYFDYRDVNFEVNQNLLQELKDVTKETFNGINWQESNIDRVKTCFYTMTQDEHFIIDFHPKNSNVIMISACSGHGFKYCPQIGQDIVKMTETGVAPYEPLKLSRFLFLNQARL